MYPILYSPDETEFKTNGIGTLSDCIRGTCIEERNGIYEAEFDYPITGIHYADIEEDCIILIQHDHKHDLQPFVIYGRTAVINGIVTFYAHHLSYKLNSVIIMPFTASSCAETMLKMGTESLLENPFTFWTDKQVSSTYNHIIPKCAKEMLCGAEGSILDVYGKGDYEYDRWAVKLYANRGQDNGVEIRYGKNLADLTQDIDTSNCFNAILPYWVPMDETMGVIVISSVVVSVPEGGQENLKIVPMDFSEAFETQPTEEQLIRRATTYLNNNKPWLPSENISVDFVALWQTEEYKNIAPLQTVSLCDKVSIYHPEMGIVKVKMQVIKTEYNFITEQYNSIELGSAKTSLAGMIQAETETQLKKDFPTYSAMNTAINNATEIIKGGRGGYKVDVYDADGHPAETLYMDTPDIQTAVNILRINRNGIAFSHDGYSPENFSSAWTIDGHFIADYIDTGTLTANIIKSGILSDTQGKNIWNLETGEFTNELGQYIRFQNGQVIIGEVGNPFTLVISNNRIGFYNGGTEVAYISDNKEYIANLSVTNSAVISGLKYYRENGHIYIEPEVV